jgi:hypothetical protein
MQKTYQGNIIWRMYFEVKDFSRSSWENKLLPLMPKRNPIGIIKMKKHIY